ncbi:hypothetical protein BAX95_17735 [Elizabethkingia meningoseptica]|nr:hypothetical protein BAX95_17735 [Elizabethkingia meningoseptica]
MPLHKFHLSHFIKKVATSFHGIFSIPFVVFSELLFFSHSDQRKEAKERRLVIVVYLKSFVKGQLYFVKFVIMNIIWIFLYSNNRILSIVILSQ